MYILLYKHLFVYIQKTNCRTGEKQHAKFPMKSQVTVWSHNAYHCLFHWRPVGEPPWEPSEPWMPLPKKKPMAELMGRSENLGMDQYI